MRGRGQRLVADGTVQQVGVGGPGETALTDAARSELLRRDAGELLDGGFACHVSGSPGLAHTVLIVEMLTIRSPSRIRRTACCIDRKVPFALTAMTRS
nr:hypothetical protein [Saccharopolyspora spinosa]